MRISAHEESPEPRPIVVQGSSKDPEVSERHNSLFAVAVLKRIEAIAAVLMTPQFRVIFRRLSDGKIGICKTQGFQVFEKVLERHVLFRATTKTVEKTSPSVPVLIAQKDTVTSPSSPSSYHNRLQ